MRSLKLLAIIRISLIHHTYLAKGITVTFVVFTCLKDHVYPLLFLCQSSSKTSSRCFISNLSTYPPMIAGRRYSLPIPLLVCQPVIQHKWAIVGKMTIDLLYTSFYNSHLYIMLINFQIIPQWSCLIKCH